MIARDQAGTALPWRAVVEVIQATGAILAEAEASGNDARPGPPRRPGPS